ncbi:universal stress protein [Oxalobacteraceae bacterium]|nr:universal stress protein [Oxalobacteraceae bacterium]
MSYRTILLHLDESANAAERIRLATRLALLNEAQLIGVAMTGISRFLYNKELVDDHDPHLTLHLNVLRDKARHALDGFLPRVRELGLHSAEEHVVDDDAGTGLSLHARYADLLVIGQTDPARSTPLLGDLPGHVILHAGRPVLVVPHAGAVPDSLRNVLIAWDASKEAARAVSAALPLLRRAEQVGLAMFDPEDNSAGLQGGQPGADIQQYLARHGVRAELLLRHSPRQGLLNRPDSVGEALLALAAERKADLLVLGAYGHSRFRETLLGGVTRTVLDEMTIPVLMAH